MLKLVISLLILLSACSSRLVLPKPTGQEVAPLEQKKIISDLRLKTEAVQNFKINSKTTFIYDEEKVVNKSVMIGKFPRAFRLQILAPTVAYTLADLVYSDGTIILYDLENRKAYTDTTNKLFEENTGIPMELEGFIRLLVGVLPTKNLSEVTRITKIDDNFYSIEGNNFYAKYSPQTNGIVEYQKLDDGAVDTLVSCLNYDAIDGIAVPQQIEVTIPKKDSKVIINIKSINLNTEIPEYILNPKKPEDIEIESY